MTGIGIHAPATVDAMRSGARALLAALPWWHRRRAIFDITDRVERVRWFYTPNVRAGVQLNQMRPRQQQLALQLLASGLSEAGFTVANRTMSFENLIDRAGSWQERRTPLDGRDPTRYAIAIFGDPAARSWGWRFEGHHLSVRYMVDGDSVSCTPLFVGGHPARVPLPGDETMESLIAPARIAVELLGALSQADRERAVISPSAPVDIVTANRAVVTPGNQPLTAGEMMDGRRTAEWERWDAELRQELGLNAEHDEALRLPEQPDGVALDGVAPEARELFQRLIDYFLEFVPDEVANGTRELVASGDSPRFAWAGPIDGGSGSYFRIRNQRLLIEFDNAQDHANHVHVVLRDPVGDFGRELLGEPAIELKPRMPTFRERVERKLIRLRG